jgi:hypothetical protein
MSVGSSRLRCDGRDRLYQPPPPPPPPPPPEEPPPPDPEDDPGAAAEDEIALENELLKLEVKLDGENESKPEPAYHEGEKLVALPELSAAAACASTFENCSAQACSTPSAKA